MGGIVMSAEEKQGGNETDKVEQKFDHSPELKEQDRKMLESIIECIDGTGLLDSDQIDWLKSFKAKCKDAIEYDKTLIEKQGKKDDKVVFPKFTFDDVLALECCMKMAEKEEELYKQLQSLHNRVHDAYHNEKKGNSEPDATKEGRDFFKFHKGDWIVHNDKKEVFFIKNISCGYLSLEDAEGITHYPCLPLDSEFHHWTTSDAKDGDVLTNKYGVIFINDGNREGKATLDSYCYLSVQYEFCINEHKTGSWLYKDGIKPATKEQRDFFFAKMKKAGYEWDAENKELIGLKN